MLDHGEKITLTDSEGEQHEAEVERIDGDGWNWRLICTNSGEELVRGEDHAIPERDGGHYAVEIYSYACVFDLDELKAQIEAHANGEMA
jgi:hypothetical protein